MTISRISTRVDVIGTGYQLAPSGGTATLDESWSPYAQADITVPLPDDDVLAAVDPRTGPPRVHLLISQEFGHSISLAKITREVRDSYKDDTHTVDLARLTQLYAGGGPLANITGRHAIPYNTFGNRASKRVTLDLSIRERRIDHRAGTVTLRVAGDEALLQDARNTGTVALEPATDTAYGVATLALAAIDAAPVLEGDDVPLEPGSATWAPGVTAWDYASGLVDAAGLRLWCDGQRVWHLASPGHAEPGRLQFHPDNSTQLADGISRDRGWYDAVHITYRWTDSSGAEHVRYDYAAGTATPTRVYAEERRRPWPRAGAAAAMLRRIVGRGRVMAVEAVADLSARPRQQLHITTPDAGLQAGFASRVSWNLNDDTMRVESRDLADTGPNAWRLVPPGIRWVDVPAGMSWDTYTTAAVVAALEEV